MMKYKKVKKGILWCCSAAAYSDLVILTLNIQTQNDISLYVVPEVPNPHINDYIWVLHI